MNFFLSIINILQKTSKNWEVISLVFFISSPSASFTLTNPPTKYNYQHIANMQHPTLSNQGWLKLIADPNAEQQFYLANDNGQIFLIEEGKINPLPLLDLNQIETNNDHKVHLTAFVLHPNFTFRDQPGFVTFYTAHLNKFDEGQSTTRLQVNSNKIEYQYDAVITEWQFNQINLKQIDPTSQREVLRVPVVKQSHGIKQLSFNPFKKLWNNDYGLLYITLPATKDLNQLPLSSGVILRINPNRFGRKSYTVPNNNPYINNNDIANEIILLGAQDIKQIIWPQKNSERLLISHHYNKEDLLTFSQHKTDWRNIMPEQLLSHRINTSKLLFYQGRALDKFHQQLLYINQTPDGWQLNSIKSIDVDNIEPGVEHKLSNNNWSVDDNLKIFVDSSHEIIILDQSNSEIYRITQPKAQSLVAASTLGQDNSAKLALFLLILTCCSALYFFMRWKRNSEFPSLLTNKHFAYTQVSQSKQHIRLWHKQHHMTETVLSIADITASEVSLNNTVISLINVDSGHGFSDSLEQKLRHFLADGYRDAMVIDKVRTINLTLTDNNQSYLIALYARKGHKRLTKKPYRNVVEEVVDWCWLVAKTINVAHTGTRTMFLPITPSINKNSTHSDNQAQKKPQISTIITAKKKISHPKDIAEEAPNTANKNQNNIIDTQLVNSLEKLVKIKQQGFLSDEEFLKAKKKLLSN